MNSDNLTYLLLFGIISSSLCHSAVPSVCDSYSCGKGECIESGGEPICICPPDDGIYVNNCMDPCDVYDISCKNNGTCKALKATTKNENASVECECTETFYGDKCQFSYCNPECQIGEICVKNNTNFECKCKDGHCESGYCNPKCQNGETCVKSNDKFECICKDGRCKSEKKNPCDPNPCGVGTCVGMEDNYVCICPSDRFTYTGDCFIENCFPNPCKNNGTCEPIEGDEKLYNCKCEDGFHGKNCESDNQDPCDLNPCKNNGRCKSTGSTFTCICTENFKGRTCEEPIQDPCNPNPCQNNGNCTPKGNQPTCICKKNFKGPTCEEPIQDPCNPNPCQNNGNCTPKGNQSICICTENFKGPTCEELVENPCKINPCKNNGICGTIEDRYICDCSENFKGPTCEERIQVDPCSSNPCKNNGSCSAEGDTYRCICSICKESICSNGPCMNGGKCIKNNDESLACICQKPFTGTFCEKNLCWLNPCENRSMCGTNKTDSFDSDLCERYPKKDTGDNLGVIIYTSGGVGFLLLAVLGVTVFLHKKRKQRSALSYIQDIDTTSTGSGISCPSLA